MFYKKLSREHEWKKHGTCSVELEEVNSIYKFFSKVVCLHSEFQIYR